MGHPTMMRLNTILIAAFAIGLTAHDAHAEKVAFMADFAPGITIPISDSEYTKRTDPSFKLSLKAGAIFYVGRHFGISAEGQFDWIPVNSKDSYFASVAPPGTSIDPTFNRVRFLGGSRFIIPFGIGSVYFRVALGLDYMTGSTAYHALNLVTFTQDSSSAVFTFEPGFGVQFNVVRHLVLGLYTGFPIMSERTLTIVASGGNAATIQFTPVDVDILAVVGIRF